MFIVCSPSWNANFVRKNNSTPFSQKGKRFFEKSLNPLIANRLPRFNELAAFIIKNREMAVLIELPLLPFRSVVDERLL